QILVLDITDFLQALMNRSNIARVRRCRWGAEETDHRHRRLLRSRRKRPRGCRAADERDERAAFHSITSSARASSVGGTSRPSALAVLRLMINSNLVDHLTGRSLGRAPRKMRSTKAAARRQM